MIYLVRTVALVDFIILKTVQQRKTRSRAIYTLNSRIYFGVVPISNYLPICVFEYILVKSKTKYKCINFSYRVFDKFGF